MAIMNKTGFSITTHELDENSRVLSQLFATYLLSADSVSDIKADLA